MNQNRGILLAIACSFLLSGCLKEDDATVLLPLPTGRIVGVVPPEGMLDHINVNEGINPPSIEGYYLATPMEITYASDDYWNAEFYDLYMAFSATAGRNSVTYREKQHTSMGKSISARIIGSGNDFTVYFTSEMEDKQEHWNCTILTIISGRVSDRGITHFEYANAMLEKNDPECHLMDVGEYHVFRDNDDFVEIYPW